MKSLKKMTQDPSFACYKYGSRYSVKNAYSDHVSKCSYEPVNGSSIQRAVNLAYKMIYLDKRVV